MIAQLKRLGGLNASPATRFLTVTSLAAAITSFLRNNSAQSQFLIVGVSTATGDGALSESQLLRGATPQVLSTCDRVLLLGMEVTGEQTLFSGQETYVLTEGAGMPEGSPTFRISGGRLYSDALLATSAGGLPNQRLSFSDFGQIVEDAVAGNLFTQTSEAFGEPDLVAIHLNQLTRVLTFEFGASVLSNSDVPGQVFAAFAPVRSGGSDFLE